MAALKLKGWLERRVALDCPTMEAPAIPIALPWAPAPKPPLAPAQDYGFRKDRMAKDFKLRAKRLTEIFARLEVKVMKRVDG